MQSMIAITTERSASTFCTFVREFSPLEVCAGQSKSVLLGGLREPGDGFGSRSLVRAGAPRSRASSVSTIASTTATPNVLGSVGDRHKQLACRARCCSVHLHPGLACGLIGGLEFSGYGITVAEVHLVWRLTTKR